MNRRTLLGGALLAAAVACADSVTDPSLMGADALSLSSFRGDAPPPPMDSTMATYDEQSGSTLFVIRVTYFYNKTGNNSWLTFAGGNGRVQATRNMTTAKGSISVAVDGGVWSADLARDVSAASLRTFGTCKWECADLDINGTWTSGGETSTRPLRFSFDQGRGEVVPPADNF